MSSTDKINMPLEPVFILLIMRNDRHLVYFPTVCKNLMRWRSQVVLQVLCLFHLGTYLIAIVLQIPSQSMTP